MRPCFKDRNSAIVLGHLEVKRSRNGNSGFTLLQLGSIFVLFDRFRSANPPTRAKILAGYERRNRKAQPYRREPGHASPPKFSINRSTEETYE